MDLIIKPTELCNFKCTFCSSTQLTNEKKNWLKHDQIFEFLTRFPETKTIIVNGGDPLMMEPDYYWKIIKWLDERDYSTSLALTTNLWPFYKKPSLWVDLFNNDRVGVTTSFQYGGGRLKGDYTEFTEEDFWKCSNAMLEYCNYRPDFISVITRENEHNAIKNVELAKYMSEDLQPQGTLHNFWRQEKTGVECKLNYAMMSGEQEEPFLLSDIYSYYVEIFNQGIAPWEFNTRQMMLAINDRATTCPLSRKCDEGIRCLQPDGDYYSCGAFGDDKDKEIDFKEEMSGKFFTPLQDDIELTTMKKGCYSCPMFNICNGCRKTIKDYKEAGVVEKHCEKMKTIGKYILRANKSDLQMTPYVNEEATW